MARISLLLAPFKPVKTVTALSLAVESPEIVVDPDVYDSWGISIGTSPYPFLQPPQCNEGINDVDLPLRSAAEPIQLLQLAQIEAIPESINVPVNCQIIGTNAREALFESIVEIEPLNENFVEFLQPISDIDLPVEFIDVIIRPIGFEISENLSARIYPPEKVMGMNYSSRYWEETAIRLPGFEQRRETRKGEKPIRAIQQGQIGNKPIGRARYKTTIWDLIFVLLQPPLNINLPENLALPHNLYPYQVKGVEFLLTNEHALLADDMGTGKTVMTLVALKILMQQGKVKSILILCPPSVLHEWKRHLEEWTPELVSTFVRGNQQLRGVIWNSPSHVYITAYSTFRNDVQSGLIPQSNRSKFDVAIIDEAHHIKNPNTAQAKSVKTLQPSYRWALTGTPVQNRIEDLHAIFEFVYPRLLTSFDTEERVKKKIAPYFLRRRKQEVLKDLPPKVRQELELELDRDQQIAYNKIERESQLEIAALGDKVTKQHIFAKLTLLKQVCNFAPGKISSPKLEDLKERVEEIIESGQKVIVFSQYLGEGIDKLEKGLRPYKLSKIVGGQSDIVRGNEIEQFKKRQDTPILLASVRSGGEGLNLAEASYVVHFDHWWNPAVMWQAEDRAHRRGQKNSVNIYSYWMADTIDDRIRTILGRKGLLIENVVDGLAEQEIDELFSMEDLLEIIGVEKAPTQKPGFQSSAWRGLSIGQIHQKLYAVKPFEFEDIVQQLMHYLGFPNVKVTKRSGDGGVDVISSRNTGQGVERIAAQVKRYRGTVGVQIAREFLGSIKDDPTIVKGLLVTTGEFTSECIAFCHRNGIEMIPGIKVAEYVKMFSLKT